MDTNELNAIVLEIVAKIANRDPEELTPEHKLAEDLGMKSISRIELAALLEDRFPVQISNFDIRKPKTIAEVIVLVQEKI